MGKASKLLRKRERNGKDPSRASTNEMTVKLEKVLAVSLVWKHFSRFPKTKLCQLAAGQSLSVTRHADMGLRTRVMCQQFRVTGLEVRMLGLERRV